MKKKNVNLLVLAEIKGNYHKVILSKKEDLMILDLIEQMHGFNGNKIKILEEPLLSIGFKSVQKKEDK